MNIIVVGQLKRNYYPMKLITIEAKLLSNEIKKIFNIKI